MAMCPNCHGTGTRFIYNMSAACSECQGSGIVSCCDTAGSSNQEIEELKDKVRRLETSLEYAKRRAAYFKQWVYSANGQQRSL